MKVLWIASIFLNDKPGSRIGGTAKLEIPGLMDQLGHEFVLVTATDILHPLGIRYSQNAPMVKWNRLKYFAYRVIYALFLLKTLVFSKLDVVMFDIYGVFPSVPFAILSKLGLLKTKFLLDIRSVGVEPPPGRFGTMRRELQEWLIFFVAKHLLDGITVITPMLKEAVSLRYALQPDKVGVWSTGVSLELFSPHNAQPATVVRSNACSFVVIYHGVFSAGRGLQQTLEAMCILADEYPEISLFLLGTGSYEGQLKSFVNSNGLTTTVQIHDPVQYGEVPNYIMAADVGIVPLPDLYWWRVSSPLKLLEYLAMEKPIIATDIEAHRLVIGDSECATYVDSIAPETLALAILNLYNEKRTSPEKFAARGKLGRVLVEDTYTWEKQAKKLEAYLKTLL